MLADSAPLGTGPAADEKDAEEGEAAERATDRSRGARGSRGSRRLAVAAVRVAARCEDGAAPREEQRERGARRRGRECGEVRGCRPSPAARSARDGAKLRGKEIRQYAVSHN